MFLLRLMMNISSEALNLPDDKLNHILDPNNFTYELEEGEQLNETMHRDYVLLEVHPNTALLCPKGYFIEKITQKMIVNSNISYRTNIRLKEHGASCKDTTAYFEDSPCPTLYNCLGFVACLFKFGNEFCKQDPVPDLRKVLLVSIHCRKDSVWSCLGGDSRKKDQVLHMRYKSRLEEKAFKVHRDYNNTVIVEDRVFEDVIFGFECPNMSVVKEQRGYRGECDSQPMDPKLLRKSIWKLLGRARSSRCRSELSQTFCAYQYSSEGLCLPPFVQKKNKSRRTFNFQSMPNPLNEKENVRQYINTSSSKVIPARLGFILLIHKNAPAAVQLLKSIWRPYHYFAVHVDKRENSIRADFNFWLSKEKAYSVNVVVLPESRSFATSWGSYQIVRAQLEGMFELLKMDSWDFVVNLSGADLPLRDVDDLSASLASHRGFNFLPFAHWKNNPKEANDSDNLVHKAYHSCDDYVFEVSETAGMPNPEKLRLFNAPQWGVFSRDFVRYLVDETLRSEHINKYQFFLQTHVIPDESYIVTVLMNSPFRDTFRQYAVHTSKEFASNNADHLCRHSTDADFCGQGPAVFEQGDTSELMSLSHRSFFARKFSSDLNDPTRKFVLGLSQDGYSQFIETFLPSEIIWGLADVVLSHLNSSVDGFHNHRLLLENVMSVRILPSLTPHDPCCASPLLSGLRKMTDHRLWMDLALRDESTKNSYTCRMSLDPNLNGRFCFSDGNLRMIFVSPWTQRLEDDDDSERTGLQETMPFPYGPAQIEKISISLVFTRDDDENFTCKGGNFHSSPITVNGIDNPISILVRLFYPDGRLFCSRKETFRIASEKNFEDNSTLSDDEKTFFDVHTFSLICGLMEAGPWTLQLTEYKGTRHSRIYKIPFYLLDLEDKAKLNHQLSDIPHLWIIKEHEIFSNSGTTFSKTFSKSRTEFSKLFSRSKTEFSESFSRSRTEFSKLFSSSKTEFSESFLRSRTKFPKMIPRSRTGFLNDTRDEHPSQQRIFFVTKIDQVLGVTSNSTFVFVSLFSCYGGLPVCVVISFILHSWYKRRSSATAMYRKALLCYLLTLSLATVLQAMLLIWCC